VSHRKKMTTFRGIDTLPICSWTYPKVLVHIPLERALSYSDRVLPYLFGIARQGPDALFLPYGEVCQTINIAIDMFLKEEKLTHLLLLDNDHEHPLDIVQRLSRWVVRDKNVQVVGGVNFRRCEPFEPMAMWLTEDGRNYTNTYKKWDWDAGLIEVDKLGAGCLLIAREVFEKIPRPWWEWDYSKTAPDGRNSSPDMRFCEKCAENGIKLYVDVSTTSPHIATFGVDKSTFKMYCDNHPEMDEEAK